MPSAAFAAASQRANLRVAELAERVTTKMGRVVAAALAAERSLLADAPVKPDPFFPPIAIADRAAAEVPVQLWPVECMAPKRNDDTRRVAMYGDPEDAQAAVRARLAVGDAADYGPPTRMAAMIMTEDGIRSVVLVGSLAAVRQAAPDQGTLDALRAAGAYGYPVPNGTYPNGMARCKHVSLDRVDRTLQMERESRGLAG